MSGGQWGYQSWKIREAIEKGGELDRWRTIILAVTESERTIILAVAESEHIVDWAVCEDTVRRRDDGSGAHRIKR